MTSKAKRAPREGSAVVWPKGVEERYGISACTRWRWEKQGRLPARDVSIGGKTGWKPQSLPA
jgi:predicted DNA-binding transcriptional regulator AlpA